MTEGMAPITCYMTLQFYYSLLTLLADSKASDKSWKPDIGDNAVNTLNNLLLGKANIKLSTDFLIK